MLMSRFWVAVLFVLVGSLVVTGQVSASDELVPITSEPILCGSSLSRTLDYNDRLVFPDCIDATRVNTIGYTIVADNGDVVDVACHVDLSPAIRRGLRSVNDARAFPDVEWTDLCILDPFDREPPEPTPTPTATPVPNPTPSVVCAAGQVLANVDGQTRCIQDVEVTTVDSDRVAIPTFTG